MTKTPLSLNSSHAPHCRNPKCRADCMPYRIKPVTYTTRRLPDGWLEVHTSDGQHMILSVGGDGR